MLGWLLQHINNNYFIKLEVYELILNLISLNLARIDSVMILQV